ncbi:hypothetical protein KAR91_65630, partial [Candidatus Pacearchaeota archaeon]|nr:hypothetical protein [Candidatus Pacearchaeota archaeon]
KIEKLIRVCSCYSCFYSPKINATYFKTQESDNEYGMKNKQTLFNVCTNYNNAGYKLNYSPPFNSYLNKLPGILFGCNRAYVDTNKTFIVINT